MITSVKKASKLVFDFQPPLMSLSCEYFHSRLFHSCLSQDLEHIYMFEHNFYIGDVKVSPEGSVQDHYNIHI